MDRRAFLKTGAAGAAIALADNFANAASAPSQNSSGTMQPNIIWLFGDQHRAQALSCMGDSNVSTPNIDALAGNGVHLDHAISSMPLCCPFRGSLITGCYPHKSVPGHEYPLPTGTPTIVDPLKAAGYHTGYFGKWHLDGWHERDGRAAMHIVPPDRRFGFDKWIGYENNNLQYDSWVHGGEGDKAFHYKLPEYETDALTNLFIDHLQERSKEPGNPFFAVLSVQPPHNPYVAPPEYMARHKAEDIKLRPNVPDVKRIIERVRPELAGYYAQIENLDWNIGRIRKVLAETGLDKNTYIFFFSDHGDMHGSHGQFHKTTPYEESIRIPLIISGGVNTRPLKKGTDHSIMSQVDFAPTTLGLAGLQKPESMQGTDYSRHLFDGKETKADPETAFIQSVVPTGHGDSVDHPWRGIVTRDGWKYVCFKGVPWLMFNLNEDPYEQVNLAHNTKFKGPRKRLNAKLAEWIEKTDDKFELPAF